MDDVQAKWTYAITSHLGCTRYEFLVAARSEQSWRFIAHSGNDFAINVSANDRAKLGGIGPMWKDVLLKHQECGGFNAIGRIAGGVAGVVGAKGVVNSGFDGVKKAIGKSGLMQGVLSPFGEVEVLDELRDMWTHESKVSTEFTCSVSSLQRC
jgi:hypothetical protein